MTRGQIIEARQALVTQLPVTGELLRGSLFERTVRHTSGCTICAGGGGRPLWVLTISYAGGRTRQFSLRREQVDDVRRWLGNYHKQPPRHPARPALWPQIAGIGLILLAGQLCWMRGCDKQHPTTVR